MWKDLKDFWLCTVTKKIDYPAQILPRIRFKKEINVDLLKRQHKLYIVRRSNKDSNNTFTELGLLREDAIISSSSDLADLSMNLLGRRFKSEFIKYRPKMKTISVEPWSGKDRYFICDLKNEYEIIEPATPVYFKISDLHRITLPYSMPSTKEMQNLFKNLKHTVIGTTIIAQGESIITHSPNNLNYWHVELNILDFNQNPVVKKKMNQFSKSLAGHLVSQILSVKAKSELDETPQKIPLSSYLKILS